MLNNYLIELIINNPLATIVAAAFFAVIFKSFKKIIFNCNKLLIGAAYAVGAVLSAAGMLFTILSGIFGLVSAESVVISEHFLQDIKFHIILFIFIWINYDHYILPKLFYIIRGSLYNAVERLPSNEVLNDTRAIEPEVLFEFHSPVLLQ